MTILNATTPSPPQRTLVRALALLAVLLAACSSTTTGRDEPPGTTEAATATTLDLTTTSTPATTGTTASTAAATLRLGTTGGWDGVVAPLTDPTTTGGPKVDIDWTWQDQLTGNDMEQQIVEAVKSGRLDLGYLGTRAFDHLGVESLAALTAPMLIDSDELQADVLASDIPARMVTDVHLDGIVAIAIGAGPLRRPMGVDHALVAPSDFAGLTMQTIRSTHAASTLTALGATPTDVIGDERNQGLLDGSIQATENSLDWAANNAYATHLTLNVALWPATGILIANAAVAARLDPTQRAWLADTVSTSTDPAKLAADDTDALATLCKEGYTFALASDADRAALRTALDPVYDELDEDATTKGFIDEIEHLKAGVRPTSPAIPGDCTAAAPISAPASTDDPARLDGAFTFTWTADELKTAIPGIDDKDAHNNAGRYTITFDHGAFTQHWDTGDDECKGTYAIEGDRVVLEASSDLAEWDCGSDSLGVEILDAAFTLDGDTLTLSDIHKSTTPDVTWFNAGFFSKPLTRTS